MGGPPAYLAAETAPQPPATIVNVPTASAAHLAANEYFGLSSAMVYLFVRRVDGVDADECLFGALTRVSWLPLAGYRREMDAGVLKTIPNAHKSQPDARKTTDSGCALLSSVLLDASTLSQRRSAFAAFSGSQLPRTTPEASCVTHLAAWTHSKIPTAYTAAEPNSLQPWLWSRRRDNHRARINARLGYVDPVAHALATKAAARDKPTIAAALKKRERSGGRAGGGAGGWSAKSPGPSGRRVLVGRRAKSAGLGCPAEDLDEAIASFDSLGQPDETERRRADDLFDRITQTIREVDPLRACSCGAAARAATLYLMPMWTWLWTTLEAVAEALQAAEWSRGAELIRARVPIVTGKDAITNASRSTSPPPRTRRAGPRTPRRRFE